MNDLNKLIQLADKIAEEAHAGQTRDDKVTPYISHPRAVSRILNQYLQSYVYRSGDPEISVLITLVLADFSFLHWRDIFDIITSAGLLHDTLEDAPNWTQKTLFDKLGDTPKDIKDVIVCAVLYLTKNNNPDKNAETYLDYLKRVKNNQIARLVKLADLKHNMSDLKPGNRLDKYLLAQYFLLN